MKKALLLAIATLIARSVVAQDAVISDLQGQFVRSSDRNAAVFSTTRTNGVDVLHVIVDSGGGGGGTSGTVTQGSTTAGESGMLNLGAVVSGDQTYTAGQTSALTLTSTGRLRVGLSSAGSSTGGTAGTNSDLIGGIYNTSAPTLTTGQQAGLQLNVNGSLKVDGSATTQPVSAASLPLPTGASTSANQTTGNTSLASIDTKLPASPATAGNQTTANTSLASIDTKIPASPATAGNQTTANTSLSSIDSKMAGDTTNGSKTQIQTVKGAANYATGQVTATTTAGTLVASRATRRSVTVRDIDTSISVYVGPATVTSGNGFLIKAGESMKIETTALVQVISASGSPVVTYSEVYD